MHKTNLQSPAHASSISKVFVDTMTTKTKKNPLNNETLQVVTYDHENQFFSLDVEGLENFLLDPAIADCKVSIISIAGAYRRGKSFLLNFFVRYLNYIEKHGFQDDNNSENSPNKMSWEGQDASMENDQNNVSSKSDDESERCRQGLPDWLTTGEGSLERVIKGFKWRGGSERETDGIVLYKRPFLIETPNHGKVVVLLMDTQGTFDSSSTVKNCATIFALSTLLSSVQIFNVTHHIQEDHLNHLQYFTEYGRLALEQFDVKPFQHLIFLVRDWSFGYEYNYGVNETFLNSILAITENKPSELQRVREHIRDCFEDVQCVLLPFPGEVVASKSRFKGNIDDISPKFLKYVSELVHNVLSPNKIVPKCAQGKMVTCRELFYYFQTYIKVFKSDILPEPKSILEANAEVGHLMAFKDAQEFYVNEMNEFCGGEKPYVSKQALELKHNQTYMMTLNVFEKSKKMGSREFHDIFIERLENVLKKRYIEFSENNEAKNILKTFRFVVVIFIAFVVLLILSETLELLGLESLNFPFVYGGRLCIILVILWFYFRTTGSCREPLVIMNQIADSVWESTQKLIYQQILHTITTTKKNTTNETSLKID